MRALTSGLIAFSLLAAGAAPAQAQTWKDVFGQLTGGQEAKEQQEAPTSDEAAMGLKEALELGARKAVEQASARDGFFASELIRIPIPKPMRSLARTLRKLGMGDTADSFEEALNRAAEKASAEAFPILADAVKGITFEDAMGILRGGETAATDYLRSRTEARLEEAFTPIVQKAMQETGVTRAYENLVRQAGPFLAMAGQEQEQDLTPYVTGKTLDGLFTLVAEQEKAIRKDPVRRTTDLLKKVFGFAASNGRP